MKKIVLFSLCGAFIVPTYLSAKSKDWASYRGEDWASYRGPNSCPRDSSGDKDSDCPMHLSNNAKDSSTFMGPTHLSYAYRDALKIMGPARLEKVKAKALEVMGPLNFKDLKVEGDSKIMGPMEGRNGQFSTIEIMGPVKVENFISDRLKVKGPVSFKKADIKNDTSIKGPLFAEDSSFQKINIATNKAELKDSKSKDIYVYKDDSNHVQYLELKGKTTIEGNIEFESGKGIVKADKDVVIKGQVKGAELQQK